MQDFMLRLKCYYIYIKKDLANFVIFCIWLYIELKKSGFLCSPNEVSHSWGYLLSQD